MYSDVKVSLCFAVVWIILVFLCYPILKRSQVVMSIPTAIAANSMLYGNRWRVRCAFLIVALMVGLFAWPLTIVDEATFARREIDAQGRVVVYASDSKGVLQEGYCIDPNESIETAFYLNVVERDNPFSVTRRANLPAKGPIVASEFRAGFAVDPITITVVSVEPWEHGYLLKAEGSQAVFRVWSFMVPEWEAKLANRDLIGQKLTLTVNQARDPQKKLVEVARLASPLKKRSPRPLEFGSALG